MLYQIKEVDMRDVINVTDENVQESMKAGLMAYKKIAKFRIKENAKQWKALSMGEKMSVARALVSMELAAKNPAKFLSKAATESAWHARAEVYAKEKNLPSVFYAFYFVPSPMILVYNAAMPALSQPLSSKYYNFLQNIQDYEYGKHYEKAMYGNEVITESERICKYANSLESGPVKRLFADIFIKQY